MLISGIEIDVCVIHAVVVQVASVVEVVVNASAEELILFSAGFLTLSNGDIVKDALVASTAVAIQLFTPSAILLRCYKNSMS